MSSYIYYKISYEGSIEKIQELFKIREWELEMKIPQEGIILLKFPQDEEVELTYYKDLIIDEETQTKFIKLENIKESDFENAENIELSSIIKNKANKKENLLIRKSTQNIEYKRQMSEILLAETNLNNNSENKNCVFNQIFSPIINLCNMNEFNKKINKEYKDPFDYFFSKNYIIMTFILAVICLVVFNI